MKTDSVQHHRWSTLAIFLGLTVGLSGFQVGAAPITFNTALPVAEDEFIFRQQFLLQRASAGTGSQDSETRGLAVIPVLGYGVSPRLALFGAFPWSDKRLTIKNGGSSFERRNQGVGDFTGFARYTLWQEDAPGRTFRVAAFAGATAPTGADDEADRLGRLPPPLQDGSGAWSLFGGGVLTWQTLDYQWDAQLSYRENRTANDFTAGDEYRLDLSWQQRLWPRQLTGGLPGFLYGVIELNGLHRERNRMGDDVLANSGGDTLWLSPGLQYVSRRWVVEAVFQQPVYQSLGDGAPENEYRFTTGFRWNF